MAFLGRTVLALVALFGLMNTGQVIATPVQEHHLKELRGNLTEGRDLVFKMNGWALTNTVDILTATNATTTDNRKQRFVLNRNSTRFAITSATDNYTVNDANSYLQKPGVLPSTFNITELADESGYSVQLSNGKYFSISVPGRITIGNYPLGFKIYSVTVN